ncbi:DUF5017 domain-containing protein [Pedobacter frigiditerrae]|uniref:DUF5017 domain-containing protein n=1 Tax=Pedobacter frigiditerrae TaxID=2530452 RepID=A0A4R0MP97_9SPHI|nr:DUF5017 domain-containing protein [Pedobacter frigiditerrae]TCC88620.1 DUF5017 domain-containing protein [Pedobacter frigiditerrae]
MIKKIIIPALFAIAILSACRKSYLDNPDLNVTTKSLTYKAGDSVLFNINGNADYISFFSGEIGKEYSKKNKFSNDVNGNAQLSFNSNVQFGIAQNNLSVLVSNNFSGVYDTTNVKNATWANITSDVILGTSATNVPSGTIKLNPYAVEGKPVYVAFRYLAVDPAIQKQRQWTVGAFNFITTHADGEIYNNALSFTDGLFKNVEFRGDSARWVINSGNIVHTGLNAAYPGDDDWVISKGFDLRTVAGDASGVIPIKSIATPVIKSYVHIYNTPGTYKATFLVRNASKVELKEKLIEFTITVTPKVP